MILSLKKNSWLGLLLVLVALRGTALIFLYPPYQVPDEENHYDYALFLSKADGPDFLAGRPHFVSADLRTVVTSEARALFQIADYYRIRDAGFEPEIQATFRWSEARDRARTYREVDTPESLARAEKASSSYNYPPLYYFFLSVFLKAASSLGAGILTKFLLARFLTLDLFLVSIVFAQKTLSALGFGKYPAMAVLAFIAFQPQLAMSAVSVQPDILGLLLINIGFYLAVRLARDFRLADFYGFHVVAGSLLLTKVHLFVPLYVPIAVYFVVRFARRKTAPRGWAKHFAAGILILWALGGWWYIRGFLLYGNLSGYIGHDAVAGQAFANLKYWVFHFGPQIFRQFWGRWGWFDYAYPLWVYVVFVFVCLYPAYDWLRWIREIRRAKSRPEATVVPNDSGLASHLLILTLPLAAFAAEIVAIAAFADPEGVRQGRHWLPFILPIAVYLGGFTAVRGAASGRRRWLPAIPERTVARAAVIGLALLNVWMIVLTWVRYEGRGS